MIDKLAVYDELHRLHYMDRDVVEELIRQKLIWPFHGTLRMVWAPVDKALMPLLAVCDFCHDRPVVWNVNVKDFTFQDVRSMDGWAACGPCGDAIQIGDRAALLVRVDARAVQVAPTAQQLRLYQDWLRAFIDLFWQHYKSMTRVTS